MFKTPTMQCTKREHAAYLSAFLRQVARLDMTLKAAAFVICSTPQTFHYWQHGRRMLKRSARPLRVATEIMKRFDKHTMPDAHKLRQLITERLKT